LKKWQRLLENEVAVVEMAARELLLIKPYDSARPDSYQGRIGLEGFAEQ